MAEEFSREIGKKAEECEGNGGKPSAGTGDSGRVGGPGELSETGSVGGEAPGEETPRQADETKQLVGSSRRGFGGNCGEAAGSPKSWGEDEELTSDPSSYERPTPDSSMESAQGVGEAESGRSDFDRVPRLSARKRGRRLVKKSAESRPQLTPPQRLLILDAWRRSELPAGDFAALVGVSKHTLYGWKRRFESRGPEGLMDKPRGGPRGSRLSEITKRAIVMLKEANPDWGCQRISDMLSRGPALPASPSAVSRVLHEAGYEFEEVSTRAHGQKPKRFERAQPNELWQTDLFTFTLKRQNRRVYLVGFMDDYSRFIVGYGLHASQSASLVLEVLRTAILNYRTPKEILTDNGSQYVTWRGKSAFSKELQGRGVRHVVATPRRPQTLGKIERFWGSLWRECLETAVFHDLDEARKRIGLYIDHYNFQRVHQGIGGLVPADRYFHAAPQVLKTLKDRVESNALELSRHGLPRKPFYLTGQAGGKSFSVHAEGERLFLTHEGKEREEIELGNVPRSSKESAEDLPKPLSSEGSPEDLVSSKEPELPPGTSPLDGLFDEPKEQRDRGLGQDEDHGQEPREGATS